MSQLINTLNYLIEQGLVHNAANIFSQEHAELGLKNGVTIVVAIPDDQYIVGIADIEELMMKEPAPEYIIHNSWQLVPDSVINQCRERNIPLVSFGRFTRILRERMDNE